MGAVIYVNNSGGHFELLGPDNLPRDAIVEAGIYTQIGMGPGRDNSNDLPALNIWDPYSHDWRVGCGKTSQEDDTSHGNDGETTQTATEGTAEGEETASQDKASPSKRARKSPSQPSEGDSPGVNANSNRVRGMRKESLPYLRKEWEGLMPPPSEPMASLDVELAVSAAQRGHIVVAWARKGEAAPWRFLSAEICTPASLTESEIYVRSSVPTLQERFPFPGWEFANVEARRREPCPFDEEPSDEPLLLDSIFEETEDEEDERPIAQMYWRNEGEGCEEMEDDTEIPLFPDEDHINPAPNSAGTVIFVEGKCPKNPGQGIRAMVVAEWDGVQYNDVQKHLLVTDQSTTAIESHSTALLGLKRALGLSTLTKPVKVLCACKTTVQQIRREVDTSSPSITHLVARSIALLETFPGRISIEYSGPEENLARLLMNDPEVRTTTTPSIFDLSLGDEPPARKARKIHRKAREEDAAGTRKETNRPTNQKAPTPTELASLLQGVKTFWTVRQENRMLLGRSVAGVIGNYPYATPNERRNIWIEFLLLPQARLIKAFKKAGRNASLVQALADTTAPSAKVKATSTTTNRSRSQIERVMAACSVLVQQGHIAKAARTLERDVSLDLPQDVDLILKELHPEGEVLDTSKIVLPSNPFIEVCPEKLTATIKQQTGGKAPGLSGWTEELLLESLCVAEVLPALCAMVADLLNGNIPRDIRDLIAAARLIPIPKPMGGVRPVAVGEALLRITEAYAFEHATHLVANFAPIQMAFVKGGAEQIIHELRQEREAGKTIITIDCINAFNCIKRSVIFQALIDKLPKFLPLFCLLYAEPSQLISPRGKIESKQGVKQGGVWSSFLFCLALQDLLEECQLRFPGVKIRAFMDDMTIVGHGAAPFLALEWLQPLLQQRLNLMTNLGKSEIYGDEEPAEAINCAFKRTPEGVKILGAWIGGAEATEIFLSKSLTKAETWFERVVGLHPATALPLMRKCGAPRWTHLARTHRPEDSKGVTERFDKCVTQALCQLMEINSSALSEVVLQIFQLPIRDGGLGVPLFTPLLVDCYQSSVSQESQSVATRLMHKSILDAMDQDTLLHLKACRRNSASSWLGSGIPFVHFGQALSFRSRLFASGVKRFACDCGEVSTNPAFASHVLGCSQVRGINVSSRHNAIRDCIASFCRRNAIPVAIEPLSGEPGQRCDLRIGAAQDLYVDIVVVNNLCKTHKGKSLSKLEKEKQDIKTSKYEEQVKSLGGVLVPFVLEAMGGMGSEARRLVKTIDKLSFSPTPSGKESPLIKEISATLQRWNGAILQSALRR
jgi:hypothetical protein